MSAATASPPPTYVFRVAIHDAHMEFLVDGEGDWFVTLVGVVEQSGHSALPEGFPIDIRFGGYEPELWGLHVGPQCASATIAMETIGIGPLKALINQCRPEGPSVDFQIEAIGEPEIRASGRGHFWWDFKATPSLSDSPPARMPSPEDPDFDAGLRIAVAADDRPVVGHSGPFQFSGKVTASRYDALLEGRVVLIQIDAAADREVIFTDDLMTVTWRLTEVDKRGIVEVIRQAAPGGVLIDLDLGQAGRDPTPNPKYVTDLAVIAPRLLSRAQSGGD